jgi:hypothetical protein
MKASSTTGSFSESQITTANMIGIGCWGNWRKESTSDVTYDFLMVGSLSLSKLSSKHSLSTGICWLKLKKLFRIKSVAYVAIFFGKVEARKKGCIWSAGRSRPFLKNVEYGGDGFLFN